MVVSPGHCVRTRCAPIVNHSPMVNSLRVVNFLRVVFLVQRGRSFGILVPIVSQNYFVLVLMGHRTTYRATCCKMGYRTDVPVRNSAPIIEREVSHHFGGLLTSLKKYRAIWSIAAIVSQYRAIWSIAAIVSQYRAIWLRWHACRTKPPPKIFNLTRKWFEQREKSSEKRSET